MTKLHAHPLTFDREQQHKIDRCLLKLADGVGAPLVMLADISGRLILFRGRMPETQSTGLAALASASFAAGVEIGNFLGLRDANRFQRQLLEGPAANLYTLGVGPDLLLITAFTNQTTLGLVRLLAQQAQMELLQLAQEAIRRPNEGGDEAENDTTGLSEGVNNQLDDLFPDEL